MANGAFKFKDNSGNVVSFISGSGPNISFSGGTLDLSGMTGLTLGGLTISGSIQNAQTASSAPSYLLTSSFNTYSSSLATTGSNTFVGTQTISGSIVSTVTPLVSGSSQISYTGLSNIPSGIVSGSGQIPSLLPSGVVSGSAQTIANLPAGTVSGSAQVSYTGLSNIPSGIVSSSLQVTGYGFSTTGSNVFVGSQVITGSLYITTDLVVQGCSSLQNITASAVSIGTNTVMLNTATPAVRFAGISVQDSGSNAGVTGSIFWDGLCNRWIYSNPSTVGYSGGMLLSGPRNLTTIGEESTLSCNYLAKSGGGDHLYDSCIYEMSGSVGINCSSPGFNLDINGVSGFNSNISSGANTSITATQNGTGYLFVGKCATSNRFRVGPTGFIIVDENSNNAGLTINQSGAGYSAIFCGGNVGIDITAPTLKLDVRGTLGIPATSGTSQYGYLRLTSNAGSSRTLDFGGYDSGRNYAMWMQATDWADLSVNSSLIINPNGGNVGIGTCTPGYKLDVNGEVAISPNTAGKNTFILTTNASNDGRLLIKSDTTNKVDIQSNGVSYFMGGNIGINCTTPNYKLHVNGCTAIDGNLRIGSGYASGNSTDPGITVQGYTNAGVYFANCGVGLGAGSSSNLLFLSCLGNVGIGTESFYGKLSVVSSDDTVLSSALWGGVSSGGTHATIYNLSLCVNSVAGLKLITRNSGASYWSMYNISTGGATGDLIFGHGSGGSGCEKLRIVNTGIACFACQICAPSLMITDSVKFGTITAGTPAQFSFNSTVGTQTTANLTDSGNRCGILEIIAQGGQAGQGSGIILGADTWGGGNGRGQIAIKALLVNGSGCGTSDMAFSLRNDPACSNFTERMRITVGGKVGIGSVAPNWLLEICCNTTATGGGGYPAMSINNPNDAGYSAYYFFKGSTNMGGMEVSNATCGLLLNTLCTLNLQTNNNTRIRICNTGESYFTCKPFFPGATLTCTYTCTFASYTAGTWLGLFAGDNGYNGAYAFTVVGPINLGGSAMYSMNFATVPYIHSSSSIGSTNGNDFYALPHTSAGHADNGALVCFRRARYNGNTPAGNRTEICMNVSYSNGFTATTYVLAWV